MDALLLSTGVVALAEVGDKTQLLALMLALRFRQPVPIVLGILIATLANHAAAGLMGQWAAAAIPPHALRWVLGCGFMAMALWALVPDRLDEARPRYARAGAFVTTLIAFFLIEMGDKTQVATVALAARFPALALVVAGSTAGMLLANAPLVFLGNVAVERLPLRLVRAGAALVFLAVGVAVLVGALGV